jgi:hypothetical protein
VLSLNRCTRSRNDTEAILRARSKQFRNPSFVAADEDRLAGTVAVEVFSYRPSLTRPILTNSPV